MVLGQSDPEEKPTATAAQWESPRPSLPLSTWTRV